MPPNDPGSYVSNDNVGSGHTRPGSNTGVGLLGYENLPAAGAESQQAVIQIDLETLEEDWRYMMPVSAPLYRRSNPAHFADETAALWMAHTDGWWRLRVVQSGALINLMPQEFPFGWPTSLVDDLMVGDDALWYSAGHFTSPYDNGIHRISPLDPA